MPGSDITAVLTGYLPEQRQTILGDGAKTGLAGDDLSVGEDRREAAAHLLEPLAGARIGLDVGGIDGQRAITRDGADVGRAVRARENFGRELAAITLLVFEEQGLWWHACSGSKNEAVALEPKGRRQWQPLRCQHRPWAHGNHDRVGLEQGAVDLYRFELAALPCQARDLAETHLGPLRLGCLEQGGRELTGMHLRRGIWRAETLPDGRGLRQPIESMGALPGRQRVPRASHPRVGR